MTQGFYLSPIFYQLGDIEQMVQSTLRTDNLLKVEDCSMETMEGPPKLEQAEA